MLLGATPSLQAQSLTWLGTLGGDRSRAYGVSDGGRVVVGLASHTDGNDRAFRWTAETGLRNLGLLPGGTYSVATGTSRDGAVVVGRANVRTADNRVFTRAFRWTSGTGMQSLGTMCGGNSSSALAISSDGGQTFGWGDGYWRTYLEHRAFATTGSLGCSSEIGSLGGRRSEARGASAGGNVVVGWSENHLGEVHAFYLRRPYYTGMQLLHPLAVCCGEANGVSENGQVIVGRAHSAQTERWHACMWWWNVSDYSPRDLGTLGGNESEAYACTDNQTAVGWSHNASGQRRAFRWTPAGGMEDLTLVYQNLLSPDAYLEVARDITPDGRYIVGWGYNAATGRTEAFLLDTLCTAHNGDVDRNGCVDDADLLAVLFVFGVTGQNLGRVDVNCDGIVDDGDLLQVLFNFGSGCS
jgi:probable HAF family extracellular repeat protein